VASDRPQLAAALDYLREGDSLVVWRLDRLGRSLKHLVEVVSGLDERVSGSSRSTSRSTQPPRPASLCFTSSGRWLSSSVTSSETGPRRDSQRPVLGAWVGGRKPVLTDQQVQVALKMYAAGDSTVADIAKVLRVSRATIYRQLPGRAPSRTASGQAGERRVGCGSRTGAST
jgi:hypothetical protein